MSEQNNQPREQSDRESPAQRAREEQRSDEYHEAERHGSTQRTTRTDVDVEDNPPAPKEKSMERDDDEGFASFEDVTFKRDAEGHLVPEENYVEEIDAWTKALPMSDQQRSYVMDFFDQDSDVEELSDKWLADLFDEKLVQPDLSESPQCQKGRVTERFVREEMSEHNQMACFYSILMASDEWDLLRMFRGDLSDREIDMALKLREQEQDRNGQQTESERGNRRGRPRPQ